MQSSVYNPKIKESFDVKFDIVSAKFASILGTVTVQEMGLVIMYTNKYCMVAAADTLKSRQDYIKQYPAVFSRPVGKLKGQSVSKWW